MDDVATPPRPQESPQGRPVPRVLAIAGSDSSGGAGIQADLKTIVRLGGYGMTAITALTAQNTLRVAAVHPVPAPFLIAQIRACIDDIGVDAIKIGMLAAPEQVAMLDDLLGVLADRRAANAVPVVFDPVMVASSGSVLAGAQTVAGFRALMDRATLVTPNLPELAVLAGRDALAGGPMAGGAVMAAAQDLADHHGCAVLAKGGHGAGDRLTDILALPDGRPIVWEDARIVTRHTHGTGCTLSSAIATLLGRGRPLDQAVDEGRRFTRAAILAAPGLGAGSGPLGHHAAG